LHSCEIEVVNTIGTKAQNFAKFPDVRL